MIARVALIGLVMAGCTPSPPPAATAADGAATCRADAVQDLVGKAGSETVFADAMRRSGARQVRRITPGASVTMDYRTDRLNATIDAAGTITSLKCG